MNTMSKRKMIVQIEIRNGKTIDDFVNFMSTHPLKTSKGIKIPSGVQYIIPYNREAEKYIKELKEEGFSITVS